MWTVYFKIFNVDQEGVASSHNVSKIHEKWLSFTTDCKKKETFDIKIQSNKTYFRFHKLIKEK